MNTSKLVPGAAFPPMSWRAVGGGAVEPAAGEGWRLLVVYRGKHCPLCKQYLKTLDGMLDEFEAAGVKVFAVSADPLDRAESEAREQGWRFPVGYDLAPGQMHKLGLFVSAPRSPEETDRPFSEPGVFAINPKGELQIIDVSNAPFARPDLQHLLGGMKFVIKNDYPIRGRG
jgi:peroxiredoxin